MTSPAHTVVFHEGVNDVLDAAAERIGDVQKIAEDTADLPEQMYLDGRGHEWLADRRERVAVMRLSWHNCLVRLLTNRRPDHDGDVHVFPDVYSDLSLAWRYEASGYSGGIIFHAATRPDAFPGEGTWQIHT